jgi:hypothetical protein
VQEIDPATGTVFHGGMIMLENLRGRQGPALLLCELPTDPAPRRFEWFTYGAFVLDKIHLAAWLEPVPAGADACDVGKNQRPEQRKQTPSPPKMCQQLKPAWPSGRVVAVVTSSGSGPADSGDRDVVSIRVEAPRRPDAGR